LRGKRINGAEISSKCTNLIVNRGGAGPDDVLALMEMTRQRVEKQFGITLHPEMQMLGFPSPFEAAPRELALRSAYPAAPRPTRTACGPPSATVESRALSPRRSRDDRTAGGHHPRRGARADPRRARADSRRAPRADPRPGARRPPSPPRLRHARRLNPRARA